MINDSTAHIFVAKKSVSNRAETMCGLDEDGDVEFGYYSKGEYNHLLSIDMPTFHALLESALLLRQPPIILTAESKQYFDDKFAHIEQLLGAS